MRSQQQATLPEDKVPLAVILSFSLYPLIAGGLLYYGFFLLEGLSVTLWRLLFLLGNLLFIASWVAVGWWARARTRTRLENDHPMAESAGTFAARSGVVIQRLYVFPSSKVDAYRTPAGSLCLSSALLRNLTPREAEVLIAHNIHLGAIKWAPLLGFASYGILGLFTTGLQEWLQHRFGTPLGRAALTVEGIRGVLMLGMITATTIWRDRREKAADAFAVKVIGDPERVVQAILKEYALSSGATQNSIEKLPDGLKERIRRIRENAPTPER
ncbi:M48 family metallopeptidase [Armatimonas rosea]|uniref:Zn-dependent protease with chaperone function n=1 Tax=Armatimonas rosea TaxID=685828 RepID=A0A7W9SW18_ARMRO|nr:M48 family metalloprotease [Armatimonas rosea]MBB6053751.1 Zn-dependent protease with chaperone function [Armatimonas rosea]